MYKKILLVIAVFLIGLGFILHNNTKCSTDLSDHAKFSKEYPTVSNDNLFVYRSIDEIITILKHGTGVVYLGFPKCPWCQSYVKYLNEAAKEIGVEKIYYFNIYNDRDKNTEAYQKIVSILTGKLHHNKEGKERIYVPSLTMVKEGKIVGYNDETSTLSGKPSEHWTADKVNKLKETIKDSMKLTLSNICTECNK